MSEEAITITIHVDAGEAVRAGSSRTGGQKLQITGDDLAKLNPQQRDTLARHLDKQQHWGEPLARHAPPVGVADLVTLARLLDERREYVADLESPRTGLAVQRRIKRAVHDADKSHAREIVAQILDFDPSPEVAAVLAATRHPQIRDALAHLYQVDMGSEYAAS